MGKRSLSEVPRAALFMGGVVSVGLNTLITWPLLGHTLTASEVGQVSALLAISALLVPMFALGIGSFAIRFIAGSVPSQRAAALRVSCTFLVLVLVPASAVAALVDSSLAAACVFFVLAQTAALVAQAILRGVDGPYLFFGQAIATQTMSLILVALLYTHVGLAWSLRVAAAVIIVCSLASIIPAMPTWRLLLPAWREITWALRFSLPVVPHLVLVVGILQGMRVLVAALDGHVALSNFQFGALIGGAAITVVQAFGGHLGTDVMRLESVDLPQALARMSRNLLLVVCLLMAGIVLFRFTFFDLWLPPGMNVERVSLAVSALLPAAVMQAIGDVQSTELMHSLKSGYMSWAMFAGTVAAGGCFLTSRLVFPAEFAAGLAISLGLGVRAGVSAALLARTDRRTPPSSQKWLWMSLGAVALAEVGIWVA